MRRIPAIPFSSGKTPEAHFILESVSFLLPLVGFRSSFRPVQPEFL